MDFTEFAKQKGVKRIAIALLVVGVASFTFWYMRNKRIESEIAASNIHFVSSNDRPRRLSYNRDDFVNREVVSEDDEDEKVPSSIANVIIEEEDTKVQPETEENREEKQSIEETANADENEDVPNPSQTAKNKRRYEKMRLKQEKHFANDSNERSRLKHDMHHANNSNIDIYQQAFNELIELLTRPNIILRPHVLHEYIALEIKSFCGTNVCLSISRDCNTNQIESLANQQTIARIEAFVPIINHARYHVFKGKNAAEVDDEEAKNENIDDQKIFSLDDDDDDEITKHKQMQQQRILQAFKDVGRNELGFGIITNRKSKLRSKYSMKWNIVDYIIYPAFLNKYYKWNINDSLYFSTLFKNFSVNTSHDDWQGSRRKIDDTYFNTGNIVNGFLIFLNKLCTKSVFLFECEDGLYQTDQRLLYRNLKVPLDIDPYNNKLYLSNQIFIKKHTKDIIHLWVQTSESNIYMLSIAHGDSRNSKEKIEIFSISLKMESIFSENYINFSENMQNISDKLNKEYLVKYPFKQSDYIPGHYTENDALTTDYRNVSNVFEIKDKDMEEYNAMLVDNTLFDIKLFVKYINNFNSSSINKKSDGDFSLFQRLPFLKLIGIYLDVQTIKDESVAALYLLHLGYEKYEKSKWKLMVRMKCMGKRKDANDFISEENAVAYNNCYQQFIQANRFLLSEDCDIFFIDERDDKQIIAIFGEYMLVMPCFNNNVDYGQYINGDGVFAKIYSVSDVIPDLFSADHKKTSKSTTAPSSSVGSSAIVRGGKWFYSYETQTLYVFERLQTSSQYPYRLRKILLHTFKL